MTIGRVIQGGLALALLTWLGQPLAAQSLGQQIFEGEAPLSATLRHSDMALPATASTCSNCHSVGCSAGRSDPLAPPELGPKHLLSALKRGSGPPIAYDEPAFCRVLATGRTPAHTVVLRAMPIYAVDETQCQALWQYLTGEEHSCD